MKNTQVYNFDRGHSLWRRLLLPHSDMQLSVLTRLTLDSQHKVSPCCKCARLALAQQAALLGPLGMLQLWHNLMHAGWLGCSRQELVVSISKASLLLAVSAPRPACPRCCTIVTSGLPTATIGGSPCIVAGV